VPLVSATALAGVFLIEPDVHRDARGFFLETYHAAKYEGIGVPEAFVQDNHSRSAAGTLRGIHLQTDPPQGKLVRVVRGAILDVAVDLRLGSATFGRWVSAVLSEENFLQMYLPAGFGHAFYVTAGPADVEYKCTSPYNPSGELGVAWNDPELAIAWPTDAPVMSERDRTLPPLAALRERLPLLT
jgi:dTDP-4-dehydrorhamnose 3,5-epimerase